jgi:hypothetical protein
LAEGRKTSALQSQATGVSFLKNRSFRGDAGQAQRKDATVYKFDDNESGYISSARHRVRDRGRSPSPAISASPSPAPEELSVDQLRKKVREKRVILDAIDIKDEDRAEDEDAMDRRDRRDADDLFRRIRKIHEDIDNHSNASLHISDPDAERRQLKRQLQILTDRLPDIASKVRSTERRIAESKMELFRLRDAREHPEAAPSIIGTGPGGSITEADLKKAKSKALVQQRLAALTGKPVQSTGEDGIEAASKRLADESHKVNTEKDNNERMTRDVEESVSEFRKGVEDTLNDVGGPKNTSTSEHERRRWEDGLGVEDEVKEFIFDLQRRSHATHARREDNQGSQRRGGAEPNRRVASTKPYTRDQPTSPPPARTSTAPPRTSQSNYSSFSSAEERAAYIKQQAEQKMAERLAALGIKHPMTANFGETPQQRAEREQREREDRIRKADEEEAQREKLRQARLQGDMPVPPPTTSTKKAPPPPPARKNDTQEKAKLQADQQKAQEESRLRQEVRAAEEEGRSLE